MNRLVHPHRFSHATKVASEKNLKTLLNATFVQFLCPHFNCIITVEVGKSYFIKYPFNSV